MSTFDMNQRQLGEHAITMGRRNSNPALTLLGVQMIHAVTEEDFSTGAILTHEIEKELSK